MDKARLGIFEGWANDYREPADHNTDKIGGLPDWPFPRESLAPDMVKCVKCGCQLFLVAQVKAPGGALKMEERLLLIFDCSSPGCDSWRALRVQKLDDGKAVPSTTASVSDSKCSSLDDDDDDDDDDDEDDDDLDLEALGRAFSDFGTALASNSKTESRKKQSVAVPSSVPLIPATRLVDNESPVAPCFYLKSQELKPASAAVSLSSNYSSISIKDEDSDNEAWAPEAYEYDPDRTNLKFMKQLDANKNQCFRYSYGGQPLLAAQEVVNVERCKLCGSLRSYEMQLMPPVIHFLLEDDLLRPTLEKWNWLTVLVYTCAKNCSDASSAINGWVVAQEDVFVQSEDPEVISLLSQFE